MEITRIKKPKEMKIKQKPEKVEPEKVEPKKVEPEKVEPHKEIINPAMVGAVMKKVAERGAQLHDKDNLLKKQERTIMNKDELHIQTLGRLAKYEGEAIIHEVFAYAHDNMFINLNSSVLGIKTKVEFCQKKKKYFHTTIYGRAIKEAKSKDDKPEFYTGNFLVKNYKDQLQALLIREINPRKKYTKLTDFFDL